MRHFERIDSTNRYLAGEAAAGAREGLVAVADYQSAGRGRLGRRWEAPGGSNVLMSVLLRPSLNVTQLHLVTVVMALAAAEACEASSGVVAELKWPNDLVVGQRKLGGILAESVAPPPGLSEPAAVSGARAVVVGLGLNVAWPPPETDDSWRSVPDELRSSATSISREGGSVARSRAVGREQLVEAVLVALEPLLEALGHTEGRGRLVDEYRRRCATLGRPVRVSLVSGSLEGVATGITEEGMLEVESDGTVVTVAAGDLVHLD